MWWLENYEEDVEHLQAFSLWWTGKYRSEYNAIMQLLRSDDAAKQAQAIAKLEILETEMPPKPAHVFKPTDITRLLNINRQSGGQDLRS